MLIPIEEYDQFEDIGSFERGTVSPELLVAAREFSEVGEMEPLLLDPLDEPNRTPHGPTEIADILTLQLSYRGESGVAAFILKGRSFATVKPSDISHQVFRLRRIADLKYAILAHVGNMLDDARNEFIHTATDLGAHYTVLDATDFARLAVVSGMLCPRDASRLTNGRCRCGYRVRGDHLNVLQQEALKQLASTHELGHAAAVVVMPTGSGKTRIAALDSRRCNAQRVLYIAHTHEILEVAAKEFEHVYGEGRVTRCWDRIEGDAPSVHLCTIQSFAGRSDALSEGEFDYVVVDEFHHAAAASYRRMIGQMKPSFLLGLTATPFRGDRQDVVELCDGNVAVEYDLRTGIETGILVPYHYHGCFDDVDYSGIPYSPTGYIVKDLNKRLIIPERDAAIIRKWREVADGLPTLAFCCSHDHAKRMASSFREAGVPAHEYLGSTSLAERSVLTEKLQLGELKVLCAVDVLNEGVDLPFIECLLFLRPTESKRVFYQQLGRGLRRSPPKQYAMVLDFIGNFHNAYRIVDYLGLMPEEHSAVFDIGRTRTAREVLNLPLGCEVTFDDRVIDIFARQIADPRRITRHNIAQILMYLYRRTSKRLRRHATRQEVDKYQFLQSHFYAMVFGSWHRFAALMADERFGPTEGDTVAGH